ncbi:MAG: IclR family transcriptional regulator [Pseudomonadota bacterium]
MSASERIPTNLRTLLILEVMGVSDQPLSPTEINRQIGLPKQTVHRLCATLVEQGFLAYEPSGKKLRPARRLRMMGAGILHASRIHIARRQILQQVASIAGETVNFVVPADDGMSYLDRVETDWPFRVQLPIGTSVPFHCTASGKVFLSSLSPAMQERIVGTMNLEAKTSNTLSRVEDLMSELKLIEQQGYAIDNEEFMDGMVAIAVPVVDDRGRYLASLAVHGPTIRLDVPTLLKLKPEILDAAHQLSEVLLYD